MAAPFYFDVNGDFQGNQLLNVVLENEADGTGLSIAGQIGYNTTDGRIQYRNATVVLQVASLSGTETLTNKTLTSPVLNTGVSGSAIVTQAGGGIVAAASASDAKVPTEKAVATSLEALIGTANAMVFQGGIDCSSNPPYPAANRGDTYSVTVAGKIGGASGPTVEAGDMMTCTVDSTASGAHAAVGANWVIVQSNIDIVPTAKGGTGSNLAIVAGDIIYGNGAGTMARLAAGTNGQWLTLSSGVPAWASLPTVTAYALTKSDDTNVTLTLGGTPASSLLAAVSITVGWTGTLALGRGGTGQSGAMVAGGVVWGATTSAMGCTAAGTTGQLLRSTGTTAPAWTSATFPATAAQGDILYASATNVWSALAKSTTANSFLKNSGSSNNPAWATLALTDMPSGLQKSYKALYEATGAATTTLTISAATHGLVTPWNITVDFYRENGSNYIPTAASITINKTTGEVIVSTQTAQKGYVILSQIIGNP